MKRVDLFLRDVAAVALFAGQDETRFCLCGVRVEVKPGQRPLLVACDGKNLAAISCDAQQSQDIDEEFSFTIRRDFIEEFAKCNSYGLKHSTFPLTFTIEGNGNALKLSQGNFELRVSNDALIDDTYRYPNWREVIPRFEDDDETAAAVVNPGVVATLAQMAKILNLSCPDIQIRIVEANTPIIFRFRALNNFYAISMPVKWEAPKEWAPDWLGLPKKETV